METTPEGKKKQKYKIIGYYKEPKEALAALSAYNADPAKVEMVNLTFTEVYDKWSARKYDPNSAAAISDSNVRNYKAAYKRCTALYNMRMADIKLSHLQNVVDNSEQDTTLKKVKVLYSQLFEYAMANDIVNKDYSEFVTLPKFEKKIIRIPFNDDERKKLWENVDRYELIDTIIIMNYTGLRISELLGIDTKNVFIKEKYMRGGMKTEAGIDRIIPLHERIIPLIQKRFDINNPTLIVNPSTQKPIPYRTYLDMWNVMIEQLRMAHFPHDCRHTFATEAKRHGMDNLCRKRILGHASKDITDKVYTHTEIEELIREVNKLP
jgi:integrase